MPIRLVMAIVYWMGQGRRRCMVFRSDKQHTAKKETGLDCMRFSCVWVSGSGIGPEDRVVGPQAAGTTCGPCSRKGGEDNG